MPKLLLIAFFCVLVACAPAVAQTGCMSLSEGLRCANDSAYVKVSEMIETAEQPSFPSGNAPAKCLGSDTVFLRDAATCR